MERVFRGVDFSFSSLFIFDGRMDGWDILLFSFYFFLSGWTVENVVLGTKMRSHGVRYRIWGGDGVAVAVAVAVGVGNTSLGGAVAWYFVVSGSWDSRGWAGDGCSQPGSSDRRWSGRVGTLAGVVGKNASAV